MTVDAEALANLQAELANCQAELANLQARIVALETGRRPVALPPIRPRAAYRRCLPDMYTPERDRILRDQYPKDVPVLVIAARWEQAGGATPVEPRHIFGRAARLGLKRSGYKPRSPQPRRSIADGWGR